MPGFSVGTIAPVMVASLLSADCQKMRVVVVTNQWQDLFDRAHSELEVRREKVGADNFYSCSTLREVMGWMQEMSGKKMVPSSPKSGQPTKGHRKPSAVDRRPDDAVTVGTGQDSRGQYRVVRYQRAKKFWLVYDGQSSPSPSQINIARAVELTQTHLPGRPGASAFDRAYTKSLENPAGLSFSSMAVTVRAEEQ